MCKIEVIQNSIRRFTIQLFYKFFKNLFRQCGLLTISGFFHPHWYCFHYKIIVELFKNFIFNYII